MTDIANHDMILGEMRGQLRGVVDACASMSAKLDGLTREVVAIGPLGAELASIEIRIAKLEADRERREGATGVMAALVKSPAAAWLVGGAAFVWGVLTGRIHL